MDQLSYDDDPLSLPLSSLHEPLSSHNLRLRHAAPCQMPLQPQPEASSPTASSVSDILQSDVYLLQSDDFEEVENASAASACSIISRSFGQSRKEKLQTWTVVTPKTEDGHNWRKYGQKHVSGERYPREYFRCCCQKTVNCPAKRYVQRSDKDPEVFEITYNGFHTCTCAASSQIRDLPFTFPPSIALNSAPPSPRTQKQVSSKMHQSEPDPNSQRSESIITTPAATSSVLEILQSDDFEEVAKEPTLLPPKDLSLQKHRIRKEMSDTPPVLMTNSSGDGHTGKKYGRKETRRAQCERQTYQVKISSKTEPAKLNDGFSWRKYGQKDILGFMYPRSYYKCTHHKTQNCSATKQVQRSNEDPTVFEVTCRGTHTCSYAGAQNPAPAPTSPQKKEQQQQQQQLKINDHFPNSFQQNQSEEIPSKLEAGLRVETENLDNVGMSFPPSSFPSRSFGLLQTEHYISCPLINSSSILRGSFSSSFFSPSTPAPALAWPENLAPASPETREQALCFLSNEMREFKLDPSPQSSESCIAEESSSIYKAKENNEVTDQSKQATMSLSVRGKNLDVNQYPKGKDGLVQTEGAKENHEEIDCEHAYEKSDSPAESDDEGDKLVLSHMDKKKKAPKESHWKKESTPLIECHSLTAALKELHELSHSMMQKKKPSEGLGGIGRVNITAHIIEKILTSEVGTIGIHGRDEIAKRDVIECLTNLKTLRSYFDKVILVTLPANCGMMTRKLALAQLQSSLCIEANEDDLLHRTAHLLKRMRFLLVIDNIDMQSDMNKMGIPTPSPENGSKIIILTRLEQVCNDMAMDETINLDDETSWGLFCENASGIAFSTEIKPIAREIVRLCNHCSRAIILMARALKNESEYSEWISARNKLLLEVGLDGKDEDIMSAALEFSFEGLEDEMTINCLKSIAFNNNKEITKESLIGNWIRDGVLNTLCEGNKILENLIDLKLVEIDGYRDIVKLQDLNRDIFMNFIVHPEESCMYIKKGGLGLVKPPDEETWEHAKEICLMQNEISKLPENPSCPLLSALFLQKNYKLRAIPSSFFLNMPSLQVLNLSKTRIKSLPESLFQLFNLKRLFLRSCNLLRRLPTEIRNLKHLEVLDLEGTKIVALPEGVRELENLFCLEVSVSESENHVKITEENPVIPRKVLVALSQLEELNIDIDSEAEWWDSCIECIIDEICSLKNLDSLHFYFPSIEHFSHFNQLWTTMEHPALSCFKFIVGQHANRIMSQIPSVAEFELERWDRCLMYINGVGIHNDIRDRLSDTQAFLLERNSTIKNLSEFGGACLQQLKCCVLGECNELREFVDGANIDEEDALECDPHGAGKIFLGSLEFLYFYRMKNLTRIWKGPLPDGCLSNLKCLTLKTCPKLTCVFTKGLVRNLCNLDELVVDDCPTIVTLVTCKNVPSAETSFFLPKLRSITLHYVPELISISVGLRIAPKLEWLSFYNCKKLKSLSIEEVSSKDLRKIRGELSWWKDLQWNGDRPDNLDDIFVPFDILEVP